MKMVRTCLLYTVIGLGSCISANGHGVLSMADAEKLAVDLAQLARIPDSGIIYLSHHTQDSHPAAHWGIKRYPIGDTVHSELYTQEGKPVAQIVFIPNHFFKLQLRSSAYLEVLDVLPEYRSQGIGRLMVKLFEQLAREYAATIYTVDSLPETQLFYEKLGYRRDANQLGTATQVPMVRRQRAATN